MEKIGLKDFRYSYIVSSDEDKSKLIESVHLYPDRFSPDAIEYASFLFSKYDEVYDFNVVDYKEVLSDTKYSNREYNHSPHIIPDGFKIVDKSGEEYAQGILDYQKSLKLVQIYYFELLKPLGDRSSLILDCLIRNNYSDNVTIRYL